MQCKCQHWIDWINEWMDDWMNESNQKLSLQTTFTILTQPNQTANQWMGLFHSWFFQTSNTQTNNLTERRRKKVMKIPEHNTTQLNWLEVELSLTHWNERSPQ